MLITLLAAAMISSAATTASASTASEEEERPASYVVLVDDDASTIQALFERYPELATSFEALAMYNLLRPGRAIEIPVDMLSPDKVHARVKSFFGEAEVKRSFDDRYIPLVPNLLLREGDELRTWRGAGVRILFDDGNYVFLKSESRARLTGLQTKGAPATSRLVIDLTEGGVWSEIEHPIRGRYEIRTPTASTIIRGTEFRVKVEAGDTTRLEVLDGEVELEVGGQSVPVGAQQGALASGTSDASTFPLPPAPELLSPLSEEVLRDTPFDQTFQWAAVPDASAYVVEIARDPEFFSLALERRVGPEPMAQVLSLEPGTYFWRVSAIDANGFEGSPSESRYFVHVERAP